MECDSRYSSAKPLGGFVFISVPQLCSAWTAYRKKSISLIDLRVWIGCWELTARRCGLATGRTPRFSAAELSRIVGGVGEARVRSSLRRLGRHALLHWSAESVEFAVTETNAGCPMYRSMIGEIINARRKVPVPRRTVRLLAETSRKVVFATVLGHLFRCMYYRSGRCESRGTCKASWIATVFGVDRRNVKAARSWLVEVGWLSRKQADQWRLNRYGGAVAVELQWEGVSKKPPRFAATCAKLPPPESNQELLTEFENQKPAFAARTGSSSSKQGRTSGLSDVKREDLRSISRMAALHRSAVAAGLAKEGEAGLLAFAGAAVHAVRTATRNPCGLFATMVRKGLWHYVTQADEDYARTKLKGHFERNRNEQLPPDKKPGTVRHPAVETKPQHLSALLYLMGMETD